MATIIITLTLILSTIGIPLAFIFISRRKARKQTLKFLTHLSREGSKSGLSFSGKEVLKNKIIGFDGLRQVLLVLEFENDNTVICINIRDVKSCSLEKRYHSIIIGTGKKPELEPHLRSIDLQFTFIDKRDAVSVPFYESRINGIYEMAELEAKAQAWETLLSKMIHKKLMTA